MTQDTDELMAALRLAWARNERLQARVRFLEAQLQKANDTDLLESIICAHPSSRYIAKDKGGDGVPIGE